LDIAEIRKAPQFFYVNAMLQKLTRKASKISFSISQRWDYSLGKIEGNLVKAFWYKSDINFGDLLSPLILREYGLRPFYTDKYLAEVVTVGSILSSLPETYSGYIFGTGLIRDEAKRFPNAKIIALRGAMTRERIGASENTILGDPGLLSSKFINRQKKTYKIGIVPHYKDKDDKRVADIFKNRTDEINLIDVQKKPLEVIREIDKCDYIISSSLHGIVVADSLGIPNAWVLLSDKVVGDGFKFYDYATGINSNCVPNYLTGEEDISDLIDITRKVPENVKHVTESLDIAFRKMANEILEAK
jgi:pyruvyltransferase